MKIRSIQSDLLCEITFLNAGRGPGDFYRDCLPVHLGVVDALPEGVSALVVTADLQGRETFDSANGQPIRLLGEVLPSILDEQVLPELDLDAGRIGVLLAGDFYTVPALDKRGGTGDVLDVWRAFAERFDWVVGVAGNHDLFGGDAKPPKLSKPSYFLDANAIALENLTVAGISGIPGNPRRPWRRTEDDFSDALELLLIDAPDIVVMHDGPDAPQSGFRGSPRIRHVIESAAPTLIVRGHSHWPSPLAKLANGTQVLNVDARVVILVSDS